MFGDLTWRKMKNNDKDSLPVLNRLKSNESDNVSACSRFLTRHPLKDTVWILTKKEKNAALPGIIISSKSTILPVFFGRTDLPEPKFSGDSGKINKIHSIQGLKQEVLIMEDVLKKNGRDIADFFDYDLMSLDSAAAAQIPMDKPVEGLVLREPRMTDLDALAPLQAAYEHEEVLHKGSFFSPAASRVNLTHIVAGGMILAAEMNGRLVGKINVSGVSFTRYLVGGVFLHPDFRGQGIARLMTAKFIKSLAGKGMGITLFVKKANIPAQRLYKGLGFKVNGDYRISYLTNKS